MLRKIIIYGLLFSLTPVMAQKKERVPSYFGFQVKPIFPGVFIGTTKYHHEVEGFITEMKQAVGYSFGGVIRVGLTKLISIETGLNLTQRNFDIDASVPDSNIYVGTRLSYLTYDLPISALFYIQLSEQFYMNASIGGAISYNPTVAGVQLMPDNYNQIRETALGQKVIGEALANIGFEFRSKKSGMFYIGATARVPFSPLFYLKSEYSYQGLYISSNPENDGRIDGSYISLAFKYFFPIIKSKGSPIKTPIE